MPPKKSVSSKRTISVFNPWVILGGILIALLAVGSTIFSGCMPGELPGEVLNPAPPTTAPLPNLPVTGLPRANVTQGAWYTVYFTRPEYPEKKENRVGGVDHAIAADFERAQKTIDVAVFDLRLSSLTDALMRAAGRGVQVRALVDYDANQDAREFADAVAKIEKAGIPIVRDTRSALMHNKFALIDNHILWTGSMNFTPNDAYRNNNNMLRLDTPSLLENYSHMFERLFMLRALEVPTKEIPNPRIQLEHGITIENYFSPNGGAQQAIIKRIQAAKRSIRITAFSFTDDPMAELLIAKKNQGVQVQAVFETRNNTGLGAEYSKLKDAGIDILQDGNCYTLHSKLMMIDDRTVITGSYNFTDAANKTNDENLLIIDDPVLARSYIDEFNRIYNQASRPTQCSGS
jgi:phosphatidylserine/phosphatidylglycerophosphate/cardiolipin synthase-like enzyme